MAKFWYTDEKECKMGKLNRESSKIRNSELPRPTSLAKGGLTKAKGPLIPERFGKAQGFNQRKDLSPGFLLGLAPLPKLS